MAVVGLCVLAVVVASCTEDDESPALSRGSGRATEVVTATESAEACDDRIQLSGEPPAAARADGLTDGVGTGNLWFYAGLIDRWGEGVIPNGAGFQGKLPMWVGTDDLPVVFVLRIAGDPLTGTMSLNPTSDGLPGPLPAGAYFPAPGCWQITAFLGTDAAQITVHIP
ncbi:MAG: hypothetical protein M3381_13355 [Actinomycetota bacterium]|nr:hypothetical protein [Actinomycetota bacterium]